MEPREPQEGIPFRHTVSSIPTLIYQCNYKILQIQWSKTHFGAAHLHSVQASFSKSRRRGDHKQRANGGTWCGNKMQAALREQCKKCVKCIWGKFNKLHRFIATVEECWNDMIGHLQDSRLNKSNQINWIRWKFLTTNTRTYHCDIKISFARITFLTFLFLFPVDASDSQHSRVRHCSTWFCGKIKWLFFISLLKTSRSSVDAKMEKRLVKRISPYYYLIRISLSVASWQNMIIIIMWGLF